MANFKGYPLCIPYRLLYRFSPSLAFQAVCFWLVVDGCYFLCSTLRRERNEDAGKVFVLHCLELAVCFWAVVGGVFGVTYMYIIKSTLFVEYQRVIKITLLGGIPGGGGALLSGR